MRPPKTPPSRPSPEVLPRRNTSHLPHTDRPLLVLSEELSRTLARRENQRKRRRLPPQLTNLPVSSPVVPPLAVTAPRHRVLTNTLPHPPHLIRHPRAQALLEHSVRKPYRKGAEFIGSVAIPQPRHSP